MTNKIKFLAGLVGTSAFAIGLGSAIKGGVAEVKADEVEFEEVAVDVTEAHLSAVAAGSRYKLLIWFNGERTVDFNFNAGTTIDTNGKTLAHPVNTYKYVDGVEYNGVKATPFSGWDNRCEFRRSSEGSGGIRQFAFDLSVNPVAEDKIILKQGMEIPSYEYCFNGVEQGVKPKKFVLDRTYVFTVGTSLDLRAIQETYIDTAVDKMSFQSASHKTRKFDGYFQMHLTVNDYPTDPSGTGAAAKGKNFWAADYTSKIGNSSNVKNASFVQIKGKDGSAVAIANDYGQELMLYKGDNYKGCFAFRQLNFFNSDDSANYPTEVTIKAGTKFVSYEYLVGSSTVPHSFRTTEDVKLVPDETITTDYVLIPDTQYATELAALKTSAKTELGNYNGGADNYTINKNAYDSAIATGESGIDACTKKSDVPTALANGKTVINAVDDDVVASRKLAKAALLNSKNSLSDDVTFRSAALTKAYEDAVAAVEAATTVTNINKAKEDGIAAMEAVPTDAEIKTAAKAELAGSYDPDEYKIKAGDIADILTAKNTAIDNATTETDVNTAVSEGKTAIAAVSKDAAIRAAAKDVVDAYNGGATKYTLNASSYNDVISSFNTSIAAADTQTKVDAAVLAAKNGIDAIDDDDTVRAAAKSYLDGQATTIKEDRTFRASSVDDLLVIAKAAVDLADDLTKIETAKTNGVNAMSAVKTDATIRSEAKAELAGSYNADEYKINAAQIGDILTAKNAAIDNATTETAVNTAVSEGKTAIDAVVKDATIKSAAYAEVAVYEGGADAFKINASDYTEILSNLETALAAANTQTAVDNLVTLAKAAISLLDSDAEIKAAVVAEVAATYESTNYTLNAAAYDNAFVALGNALEAADTQTKVDAAKNNAIAALNAIDTDAKVRSDAKSYVSGYKGGANSFTLYASDYSTAKNAADSSIDSATTLANVESAKTTFVAAVNNKDDVTVRGNYCSQADAKLAALDMNKYTEENQNALRTLVSDAKASINSASSIAALDAIMTQLDTDIAAVPVKSGGCGGSIVATSAIVSLLALAGAGLLFVKRKED